jgi:hypothetical protein
MPGGTLPLDARRKERLMGTDDDPGARDMKYAFTGMALLIGALIVVSILSQVLS